eukprot:6197584-Pleurochrysis_carterae.AAC.2
MSGLLLAGRGRSRAARGVRCLRRLLCEARVEHVAVGVWHLLLRQFGLADERAHVPLEREARDVVVNRHVDRQAAEQPARCERPDEVGVCLPQPLGLAEREHALHVLRLARQPLGHVRA